MCYNLSNKQVKQKVGPSYNQTSNGTVAGYGNPAYTQTSPNGYVNAGSTSLNAALGLPSTVAPLGSGSNPSQGKVQGDSTVATAATAPTASAAPAVDPNAGKIAAYNTENQGVLQNAASSTDSATRGYGSSILDYLGGARQQQNAINNQGVQSELSRRQAGQGILDFVNHGIQSGGVMLANRNAGTSSATEALARAYSTLGAHQGAGVGTQYAQDQNNINTQQTNLGIANQTQARHNEDQKAGLVQGIVGTAQQAINGIQANMQYASLPQQINFQQEIAQIQADAQAKLNALDSTFSQGVAGINPSSLTERQSAAQGLANAGTGASNPYNLTTQAPATFQGGSPAGGDLPIFTLPRSKQTA